MHDWIEAKKNFLQAHQVNAFTKCNNFPLVCLCVAYVRMSFCLSVCKSYCTDQVVTSKCNCMQHMSPWFCLYYTPSSICLKFLCLCCSICKVEVLVYSGYRWRFQFDSDKVLGVKSLAWRTDFMSLTSTIVLQINANVWNTGTYVALPLLCN